MNITIHNPKNRDQKYTIRYRATYDRAIEGLFTIQDGDKNTISITEEDLFEGIRALCREWVHRCP